MFSVKDQIVNIWALYILLQPLNSAFIIQVQPQTIRKSMDVSVLQ